MIVECAACGERNPVVVYSGQEALRWLERHLQAKGCRVR